MPATPAPPGADRFRPDVEGLRGLAILLVIAFHAAPEWFAGGFVGVDVFFVISGFLITGLLYRELQGTGRVDLVHFYSRRARRLLPAAALALGATFLLSALVIPPLDLPRVAGDGVSAALSVANIRFALASSDYFSAVSTPSPFLHYWSLSLEEQFYLLWPALLMLVFALARGARGRWLTLALVAALSLVAAVAVTDVAVNWAFYSLPTRAWQLALGGLLAVSVFRARGAGRARHLLALVGWLGLVAVLAVGLRLDAAVAYPGLWALVPTLGAVAIIAGGDSRFGPGVILRRAPMRFLGRISYALYLWHWPLLVLPAIALGEALSPESRLALVLLAVLIATVSTLAVEEPIRRSRVGSTGRRQLAMAGALGLVMAVSVGAGVGSVTWVTDAAIARSAVAPAQHERTADRQGAATSTPSAAGSADDARHPGKGGETAVGATPGSESARSTPTPKPTPRRPRSTPAPRATPKPTPAHRSAPTEPPGRPVIALPANVRPSVWKARDDEELLRRNGCLESEAATDPRNCVFGATKSRFVVALVGDSHASHWFPALQRLANQNHWRLLTFVKVSCPFTDIPVRNLQLKRRYRECERFNENTVAALGRLKPELVITAQFRFQYPVRSQDESAAAQGAGIARMLDRVPGRKVVIADVPFASVDVPACLSKHLSDIRPCAVLSYRRSSGGSPERERIAAKLSGATLVNVNRHICGGPGDCPVVSDGMIIFRDEHHLTATYSRSLAPLLQLKLKPLVRGR